jgi:glucokinase
VALKDEVERRFRLPAAVMNDANAAAAGERAYGGVGSDHFVCITVGTGIGAGLILDGRLVEGARFLAGEIGHVPVLPDGPPCVCGNVGCLETIASGSGMIRRYRDKTASAAGAAPAGSGGAAGDPPLAEIVRRAGLGDEAAAGVLEEAAEALGAAVAFIVQLLDVEAVVLAGGVVKMDWPFVDRVSAAANRLVARSAGVTVRKSGLVDVNAILGAVARLQPGAG